MGIVQRLYRSLLPWRPRPQIQMSSAAWPGFFLKPCETMWNIWSSAKASAITIWARTEGSLASLPCSFRTTMLASVSVQLPGGMFHIALPRALPQSSARISLLQWWFSKRKMPNANFGVPKKPDWHDSTTAPKLLVMLSLQQFGWSIHNQVFHPRKRRKIDWDSNGKNCAGWTGWKRPA